MMKSKEEYLAMMPPYLTKEQWQTRVEQIFAPTCWWSESDKEAYLSKLFNRKPVSMLDRWRLDAEYYERKAREEKRE